MGNLLKLYTRYINISLSKNVKSFKIYMYFLYFIDGWLVYGSHIEPGKLKVSVVEDR